MFTNAQLARDPRFWFSSIVLGVFVICGALAPAIATFDPNMSLGRGTHSLLSPGSEFLLGTDVESRDVFSRMLYGARASLFVASASVLLSMVLGTAIGLTAGYRGGWIDSVLMRTTDLFLSIPSLILLLAAGAFLGKSQGTLIVCFAATGWMHSARMVRAEARVLREREFILAARGLGLSNITIMWRHVLPHAAAPAFVASMLGIGAVLAAEASLSFLGFGIPDPQASWGKMAQAGIDHIQRGWWVSLFPSLAIALCVTAATLLGDALNDARDGGQNS
ncbi:MAG: ABC transporter permease [Planctomycetota bacterium]